MGSFMKGLFLGITVMLFLQQNSWSFYRVSPPYPVSYQHSYSFAQYQVKKGSRIAIIGAGFAGLHLTRWLKENGYKVTTYEKNAASSAESKKHGKAFTLDLGQNSVIEMGPIQVGPTHDFTHSYQEELNIKSFEPHASYVVRHGLQDGTHQILEPRDVYFPEGERLAILNELYRLEKILWNFHEQYPNMEDVPDGSEYTQDLASFMKHHDLPHFHEMFKIYTSAYGYGITPEITAFKALHMLPASGLLFWIYFNLNPKMLSGGFGGLADALIKKYKLHENIKYNQHIKAIHRSDAGVTIENFNGDKEHFDKVIFACPIDKIIYALNDATDEEKALYENLYYSPYATFAVKIANFKKGGCIFHRYLDKHCHIQMASDNSPTDDYIIIYMPLISSARARALGRRMNEIPTIEQLRAQLAMDLKSLGFELEGIYAQKIWHEYNPHFKKPSFYKLGNSIQGHNNSYFASTMLGTIDYANEAFKQAHHLLQKHFEGEYPEPDHSFLNRMEWHFRAEDRYDERP